MTGERRVTDADAQQLMAQINHAIASGRDRTTIDVLGNEAVFERESSGTFSIAMPDGTPAFRVFPASDTPLTGYPDGVPFVASEPVTAGLPKAGSTALMWWASQDPQAVLATLRRQSIEAGWTLVEESEFGHMPTRAVQFSRDGAVRHITLAGRMVSLTERNA